MSMLELERDLTAFLIRCGLEAGDEALMLDGFCARLVEAGMPLWRVAIGAKLLHPLLDARGCRWRRGEGCVKEDYAREEVSDVNDEWLSSPFYHLLHRLNADHLRRRLDAGYRRSEFPLLDRFMDEGSTDYLAVAVDRGPRRQTSHVGGMLCSFQVDRPGGFADDEIELLRRLALPLALARQATTADETAVTLVTTYLGADAGSRVLDGAIARGTAESVRAVLWYSDLEGFTRIADTAPADEMMALLNDYAETVVGSIHAHGGQVLKFIGDGVLAMFPLVDGSAPCTRALNAAVEAADATLRLNERRAAAGQLTSGIHVALHVGDVLYGNIGSPDRLDFTVIGPAVNEVARIEALCRTLDQQMIVSSSFAQDAGPARLRLVSLGRYALKGVRRPEELFTLDAEA